MIIEQKSDIVTEIAGVAIVTDPEAFIKSAINSYRPKTFTRNFQILNSTDKTLLYTMLFIQKALKLVQSHLNTSELMTKSQCKVILRGLVCESFSVPGDLQFNLNDIFLTKPTDVRERDTLWSFINDLRHLIVDELLRRLYVKGDEDKPDKWWMCFSEKLFMNKQL